VSEVGERLRQLVSAAPTPRPVLRADASALATGS
jgi:hypothetical protein